MELERVNDRLTWVISRNAYLPSVRFRSLTKKRVETDKQDPSLDLPEDPCEWVPGMPRKRTRSTGGLEKPSNRGEDNDDDIAVVAVVEKEGTENANRSQSAGQRRNGEKCAAEGKVEAEAIGEGSPLGEGNRAIDSSEDDDVTVLAVINKSGEPDVHRPRRCFRNGGRYSLKDIQQQIGDLTVQSVVDKLLKEFTLQYIVKNGGNGSWIEKNSAGNKEQSSPEIDKCTDGREKAACGESAIESERSRQSVFHNEKGRQVEDCTVEDCTDLIDSLTAVESRQSLEGACAIVNKDRNHDDCIPLTPPRNTMYEKEGKETSFVIDRSPVITGQKGLVDKLQPEQLKNDVIQNGSSRGVLERGESLGSPSPTVHGTEALNVDENEGEMVINRTFMNNQSSLETAKKRLRSKTGHLVQNKKKGQNEGITTIKEHKSIAVQTEERLSVISVEDDRAELSVENVFYKKRESKIKECSSVKGQIPSVNVKKERNHASLIKRQAPELANSTKKKDGNQITVNDTKNVVQGTRKLVVNNKEMSVKNYVHLKKQKTKTEESSSIKDQSPAGTVRKERNRTVMVKRRSIKLANATKNKERNQSEDRITEGESKNLAKNVGERLGVMSPLADRTDVSAGNGVDQERADISSIKEESPVLSSKKGRNRTVMVKRRTGSIKLANATDKKRNQSENCVTGDEPKNLLKDTGERLSSVSPLADRTEISDEKDVSSSFKERIPTFKVRKGRNCIKVKRRYIKLANAIENKKKNPSENRVTGDEPEYLVKDTGERLKGVSPLADRTEISAGNDLDQERGESPSIKETSPAVTVRKERNRNVMVKRRSITLANAAENKKRNRVTGDEPKNLVKDTGERLTGVPPLADRTEISAGNDLDQERGESPSIKETSPAVTVRKERNRNVIVKRRSITLANAAENKKRNQSENRITGDEPEYLVKDTGERLKGVSPLADRTEISAGNDLDQERGESPSIKETSPAVTVRKERNRNVMVKRRSITLANAAENKKRNQIENRITGDKPENLLKDTGERLKSVSPLALRTEIPAGNDVDQERDDSSSIKEIGPVSVEKERNYSVLVKGQDSGPAIVTNNEKGSEIEDCTTVNQRQSSVQEIGDTLDSISDLGNETGMLMGNDGDCKEKRGEIKKHSSVKDQSIISPAKEGRNCTVLAKTQTVETNKESGCVSASIHETGMSVGNNIDLKGGEVGEYSSITDPRPVVTTKKIGISKIGRCRSKLANATVNQKRNQVEDFRTEDELRSIAQKICENRLDIPALMDENGMLLGYDIDHMEEQVEVEECSSVNDQSLDVSAKKESNRTVLVKGLGSKQVNISYNKKGNNSEDCITVIEPSQDSGEKRTGISAVGGLSVVNDVDPKRVERDQNPVVTVTNVHTCPPLVKELRSEIHTVHQCRERAGPDAAIKGLRLFRECFVVLERLKSIPPAVENREVKPTEKHLYQYDSESKVESIKQARGQEILRNNSAVSNGGTKTEVIEKLKSSLYENKITDGESPVVIDQYGADVDDGRGEEMEAVEDSSVEKNSQRKTAVDIDKGQATLTIEPRRAESMSDKSVALNIECDQSTGDTSVDIYQRLPGELSVIKAPEITENVLRPVVEEVGVLFSEQEEERESENTNRAEDKECASDWRIENEIMKDRLAMQPKGQIEKYVVAENANYLKKAEDKGTDGGGTAESERKKAVMEDEVSKKYTAEKKDEGKIEDIDKETTVGEYVRVTETEKMSAENQVLKETEVQIEKFEVEKSECSDEAKDKKRDEECMLGKKKEQLIVQDKAKKHVIEKEPKEMNELNNKQKVVKHTNNRMIVKQAIIEESKPDGEGEKQIVSGEGVEEAIGEIKIRLVGEEDKEKTEETNETCNRTSAEGRMSDRKSEEVIVEDEIAKVAIVEGAVAKLPELVADKVPKVVDEVAEVPKVVDEVAKFPMVEDQVAKLPEVVAEKLVNVCEVLEDEVVKIPKAVDEVEKIRIVDDEVAKILKVIADEVAKIPMVEDEVAKIPEVVVDEVVKIAKVQIENSSVKIAKATSEMKDNITVLESVLDKKKKTTFVGDKVVKKEGELIGKEDARESRDTKLEKDNIMVAESTSDKKREKTDVEDKIEMHLVKKDEREIEKTKELKDKQMVVEYSPERRKERLIIKDKVLKKTEEQNEKECKKFPSETKSKRKVVVRTLQKKREKQIVKNKGPEVLKKLNDKSVLEKEGECKTVKKRQRVMRVCKEMREKQIVKDGVCAGGKEMGYINEDIKVITVEDQGQKLTGVETNKAKFKKTVLKEVHGLFKSPRDENEQSSRTKISGEKKDEHLQGKDSLQIKVGKETDKSPVEMSSKPKFRVQKRLRSDDKGVRKIKKVMTEEMRRRKFEKYLAEKKRVGLFNKYILEKSGSQISSEVRKERGLSEEVCKVKKEEHQIKKSHGEKSAEYKDKVKFPFEKQRPGLKKEQTEELKDGNEKRKCIIIKKVAKKNEKGERQIEEGQDKAIRENKDPKQITKYTHKNRSPTKQYTVSKEVRPFGDLADKEMEEKVKEIRGDGVTEMAEESQGKPSMYESKKEVEIVSSAQRPVGTKETEEDIERWVRSSSDAESEVQSTAESKVKRPEEETFLEQKKSEMETTLDGKIPVGQDVILKGVQNQIEVCSLAAENKILNDASLVMKESNLKGDAEIIGELDEKIQQTVDRIVVEDRRPELNSEVKFVQIEKCSILKDETSGNRDCMVVKEGDGCDEVTGEEERQFNQCTMVQNSMNQEYKKTEVKKGEIPSQELKQREDATVMIEGASRIQDSAIQKEEERRNEECTEAMQLMQNGELISRNRVEQSGDCTIVTEEKGEAQTYIHQCASVKEGDVVKEKYGLLGEDSRETERSKPEEIVSDEHLAMSREVQVEEHVMEEERETEAAKGEERPVTSTERAHEVCRTENEGLSHVAAGMTDVGLTLREECTVEGEERGQSENQCIVEGFVDAEDSDIQQAEESKIIEDEECGNRSKAHEGVRESAVAVEQQNEEPEIGKKMQDGFKENETKFEEGNKSQGNVEGSVVGEEELQNVEVVVKKKALQEGGEGVMIKGKDAKDEVLEDIEKCAVPMEGEKQDKDCEVGKKPEEGIEECALVEESDKQTESEIVNKMQGEVECAVFEKEGKQNEDCDVRTNVEGSVMNKETEKTTQECVVKSGEVLECARAKEADYKDRIVENSTHEVVEESTMEKEEYDFEIKRKVEGKFVEGEIVTGGEKQNEEVGTKNKTDESKKSKAEERLSKEYVLEKDKIGELSDENKSQAQFENTVVTGELSADSARQINVENESLKCLDVREEDLNKICESSLDTKDDKEMDGSAVESQQEVKIGDYVPDDNLSIQDESTFVSDNKAEIPSVVCRSDSEVESQTVIGGSENQVAICAIQAEGEGEIDLCTIERIRQFIESTVEGGAVAQTGLGIVNNLEEKCGSICSVNSSGKRQLCVCGIENEGQVCSFETGGEDTSHIGDYTTDNAGGNFTCSGGIKDNANGQVLLCSVSDDEPRVLKEHTVDGNIISISVPAVEADTHVGPCLADIEVERHVKVCTIENESERHIGDCTVESGLDQGARCCTVESGLDQGARCCTVEITRVIDTKETDKVNRELGASRFLYDQNGGIITVIQNADALRTNVTESCGENGESVIQVHITEDGVQKGESDFESEVEQEAENELEEEVVLENVNNLGETIIEEFVDKDTWENQIVIVMEGVEAVQVETPDTELGVNNARKQKQAKPRRALQNQETPKRARGRPRRYMRVEPDSEGLAIKMQQNANGRSKKARAAHPWKDDRSMLEGHLGAQQNSNMDMPPAAGGMDKKFEGKWKKAMISKVKEAQLAAAELEKALGNDPMERSAIKKGLSRRRSRSQGNQASAMNVNDREPVYTEQAWREALESPMIISGLKERGVNQKGGKRSRSQGSDTMNMDDRDPVYTEHIWREALESPVIIPGLKEVRTGLSEDGMNKACMSPRMNLKKNGDSPVVHKQKMVRRPKKAIVPLPAKKMFRRFKEIPPNIKADYKNKLLGSVQLIRKIILTRKDLMNGVLKSGKPIVTGGTQILSIMTDSEEEDMVPIESDKIDGTGAEPTLTQADQPPVTTSPLKEVQDEPKENDFKRKDVGNVLPSNCKPRFKKPRVARPPKKLNKEEKVKAQDALHSMPDLSITPVENTVVTNGLPESDAQMMMVAENLPFVDQSQLEETSSKELIDSGEGHALSEVLPKHQVVTNGLPESDAQMMMVAENLPSVDQSQLEETSSKELIDSGEGHALNEVLPKHQDVASGLLQSSDKEQRNQDEASESNTIKASNEQIPPSTLGTKEIPNGEVIMDGPTVPVVQHKDQIEKPQEKKIKKKKKVKLTEGGGSGKKSNDLALKQEERKSVGTFDKVEESNGSDLGKSVRPPVVTPLKKALTARLKEKNAKNKTLEITSSKKPEKDPKGISSPPKTLEVSVTGSLQKKDVTCPLANDAGKDSSADKLSINKTPKLLECSILPLKPIDSDIVNALPSLEELMGSSTATLLNDEAAKNNGDKKEDGKPQPTLPLKKKISREIQSKATAVEDNSKSPDAEKKKIIEKLIGSDPKKKPSRGDLLLIDMFTNSVGKVSEKEKTVTGKPVVKKIRVSPVVSSQTKTPPDKSTENGAKKIKTQGLTLIDLFEKEKERQKNLLKKSDKKDVVSGKASPKEGLKSPVTSPQHKVVKDSSSMGNVTQKAEVKTVNENRVVNKVNIRTVSVKEYLKRKHSQEEVREGLTAKKLKSESKENASSSAVANLSVDSKKSDGKKQAEKERRKSISESQDGHDVKKLKPESKENTTSSNLPNLSVDSKKSDEKKPVEKERRKSDRKTVQNIPFGTKDSSSNKKTEKITPVSDGSYPAQDEKLTGCSNETDVSGASGTAEEGQEGRDAKKLKPESKENTASSNLPNLSVDSKKSDGNKAIETERRKSDRKTVQHIPFGMEDSSSNKKTEKTTRVLDGSCLAQDEILPRCSNETDVSGAGGTAETMNGELSNNIVNGLQSSETVMSGTKETAKITTNDVNHSLPLQQIFKLRKCFVLLHRLPENTVNSLRPFRRKIKKRKKINTRAGVPGAEDQISTCDNSALLERLSPSTKENSLPLPAVEEEHSCPQSPSKRQLHVCEVCGERFLAASILFAHTKKHTQEESSSSPERNTVLQDRLRPSVRKKQSNLCPYCLKRFKGKKNFIQHLKQHSDAKACKCYMCDKTFLTYYNLFVHMRTHTKEHIYPCYICQKTFAHPTTLQIHIEKIHTKKRFKCFSCEKSFMSVINRSAHMKKHHENEPV
ncbi:uncharacterized protein [Anabrus simplex]|uniref:uncharacterized protein n=1 Tax=Anabrus simplex TaxID=316456 RepID=UPI0035A3C21C